MAGGWLVCHDGLEGLDEGFLDDAGDFACVHTGQFGFGVEGFEDVVPDIFSEVDDSVVVHSWFSWVVGAGCRPPSPFCCEPSPLVYSYS